MQVERFMEHWEVAERDALDHARAMMDQGRPNEAKPYLEIASLCRGNIQAYSGELLPQSIVEIN